MTALNWSGHTPNETVDSLTLTNDASFALIANSALDWCIETSNDDDGRTFVKLQDYPIGDGQSWLWDLLVWLNGHGERPSVNDRRWGHLDERNVLAVQEAVRA